MSGPAHAPPSPIPYLPPPVPELPARLVHGAMLLQSRDALLPLLPKGKLIVEVGVAIGIFTSQALAVTRPSRFIAIDTFQLHELDMFWGRKPVEWFGERTHADWFRHHFAEHVEAGRLELMQGQSHEMLASLPDDSIDIVYVDADHRYEYVKRDLAALTPKMRRDGIIIMDDYLLVDHLHAEHLIGVIYATHEFMIEHDWAMHYLALQTNGYYQVVLRKADLPRPAAMPGASAGIGGSGRLRRALASRLRPGRRAG